MSFQTVDSTWSGNNPIILDGNKISGASFIVSANELIPQDIWYSGEINWSPKTSWYFQRLNKIKTFNLIKRLKLCQK